MRKRAVFFFVITLHSFVLSMSALGGQAPSADDIVRRADERRMPHGTIVFQALVKDYEKNQFVRESKYAVTAQSSLAGLVATTFPERQVGRKLLMTEGNLWLYTPDLKRAARVSMQQRLTGEVANGDLAKTHFAGDYNAAIVGIEEIDGVKAYRLNLKAKNPGVTYARVEYWVAVHDFMPKKALFYAVSGKVMKQGIYLDPKPNMGKMYITRVDFTDALDSGRRSTIYYSDCKSTRLPASVFSKESLGDSL